MEEIRMSAILLVHVYGNICDVEKSSVIAKKYGLKVIYDAAHAFGETYKGIGIGNFGDVSMFSFHATKVFHTIEGGAACFDNEEYGLDLYRLKNFSIRNSEKIDYVGSNANMNGFQAAMGLCNLRLINHEIEKENIFARKYFYPLTSMYDCFHGKYDAFQTPVVLYVSMRVLTVPMYADLDRISVNRICYIIQKVAWRA